MGWLQDLRFALRMLRKAPGVSAIAVLALALGIGANTAIFSLVNAVLLQPLPFPSPERLVQVCRQNRGGDQAWVSIPDFLDWRKQTGVFAQLAAYDPANFNLSASGAAPVRVAGNYVDTSFLATLGVRPSLGGDFRPSDDQTGRPPVALISHRLWQARFGADPAIVGRVVHLNGQPVPILGVLPAAFRFPGDPDILEPLQPEGVSQDRSANVASVIGRLRPDVSLPAAQAQMRAVGDRLAQQFPQADGGETVGLVPLQQQWSGVLRPALLMLFGAVGLVLLIACADLANLLLSRAAGRQKEIAVRMAMGAPRGRILRQLLTESVVLALAGAALGLAFAYAAARAIVTSAPTAAFLSNSLDLSSRIDLPVLLFTLALAVSTGLLFGLAPALQIARADINLVLQQESGRSASSRARHLFRSLLIVGEIALTLPLLLAAAVLLSSLAHSRNANAGFNPQHLLTAHLPLAPARYSTAASISQLTDRLLPRLRALPGVQAAAITLVLPLTLCPDFPMTIGGRAPDPNNTPDAQWHPSTSQTFRALGVPILRGRGFLDSDTQSSAPIAVINQAAALTWWPHQDPIGQTIWIGKPFMGPALSDPAPRTIVGVVGNVRQDGLNFRPPPAVYIPLSQMSDGVTKLLIHLIPLALVVRTAGPADALRGPVQSTLWSQDPQQPISDLLSMTQVEATSLAPQQFILGLLGAFALLALVLAAVGIYGVMSYAVSERTREIGLRLAIGAAPAQLLRMVLLEGLQLALVGVALGAFAGWGLLRLLAHQLSSLQGLDPSLLAWTALTLLAIALVACLVPAARASRLDPLAALRQD